MESLRQIPFINLKDPSFMILIYKAVFLYNVFDSQKFRNLESGLDDERDIGYYESIIDEAGAHPT